MTSVGGASTTIFVRHAPIKVRHGLTDGVTILIGDDCFLELPNGGLERLEVAIANHRARNKIMADAVEAAGQSAPTAPGATA